MKMMHLMFLFAAHHHCFSLVSCRPRLVHSIQFDPSSGWVSQSDNICLLLLELCHRTRHHSQLLFYATAIQIWRRWKGTVFSETWISCVRNVVYALLVLYIYRTFPRLQGALTGFNTLWGQILSVTTFTLTFFVSGTHLIRRNAFSRSARFVFFMSQPNLSANFTFLFDSGQSIVCVVAKVL